MSYQLSEASINLLNEEQWERIIKFDILGIAMGVVVTLALSLIMTYFSNSNIYVVILLCLGVFLTSEVLMLSTYETWRGCRLPN